MKACERRASEHIGGLGGVPTMTRSFVEVVRLRGKPCALRRHFRGCARQVVGYLERLGENDPQRFVWASMENITGHAAKWKSGPDGHVGYSGRWVRVAVRFLEAHGIIKPARRGSLRGWVVVGHTTAAEARTCTLAVGQRVTRDTSAHCSASERDSSGHSSGDTSALSDFDFRFDFRSSEAKAAGIQDVGGGSPEVLPAVLPLLTQYNPIEPTKSALRSPPSLAGNRSLGISTDLNKAVEKTKAQELSPAAGEEKGGEAGTPKELIDRLAAWKVPFQEHGAEILWRVCQNEYPKLTVPLLVFQLELEWGHANQRAISRPTAYLISACREAFRRKSLWPERPPPKPPGWTSVGSLAESFRRSPSQEQAKPEKPTFDQKDFPVKADWQRWKSYCDDHRVEGRRAEGLNLVYRDYQVKARQRGQELAMTREEFSQRLEREGSR